MQRPSLMRAVILAGVIAGAAWPLSAIAGGATAAVIKLRDGTESGRAEFLPAPGGALIRLKMKGLTPGGHAVKVHETGKCDGDFTSAGAVLNPLGAGQGLLNDEGPAAGDLPNLFAAATGETEVEFITPLLQPGAEEGDALLDEDGAAIIVYEKPDDHLGVSEGVAGERVACGLIGKSP